MFFAGKHEAAPGSAFQSQYKLMLQLIEQTQLHHPGWFCHRRNRDGGRPGNWRTFFVEVKYRDLSGMNAAWAQDTTGRFRKRRELLWLPTDRLLDTIVNTPDALWKRIREYEGMRDVVLEISSG